jgi:regulator of sigma E protease
MNFLLAWFLLSIGFTFGMQPLLANQQDFEKARAAGIVEAIDGLYVHEIAPDSPLKTTVLKVGDYITAVNGTPVTKAENLSPLLQPDTPVAIEYYHETKKNSLNVTSNSESKLGISISSAAVILKVHNVSKPFYKAPFYALSEVGRLSFLTVKMLGEVVVSIVAKFTVPEGVAGPVGIAKMTNYFVKQGFMALLQFTALISISLAVINVMPFPALDGGRFLFIIFEVIARRRPSPKWESAIHSIGFALLMLLIVIVTWNDIASLFT